MLAEVKSAMFLSQIRKEFVRNNGDVKVYYKASLVQDGSEPLTVSLHDSLVGRLEPTVYYDFIFNIYQGQYGTTVMAVDANHAS